MSIDIDIQIASAFTLLPSNADLTRWATAVLEQQQRPGSLTLRIVDEAEITELNGHYRGKQKPTNVLSFPMEAPSEEELLLLGESDAFFGDVIICAPVVDAEAKAQGKPFEAHFAHMVVHGTLHLLGYDHVTQALANVMEPLEIEILSSMQFANPYEVKHSHE